MENWKIKMERSIGDQKWNLSYHVLVTRYVNNLSTALKTQFMIMIVPESLEHFLLIQIILEVCSHSTILKLEQQFLSLYWHHQLGFFTDI